MLTKNIVPDEQADFSYYKTATPLYLQKTYGILEHEKLLYDTFINNYPINEERKSSVASTINAIFNSFNIFSINDDSSFTANSSADYLEFLDSLADSESEEVSKSLEMLASFFGISKYENVSYEAEVEGQTQTIEESLELSNKDLLTYLKCKIVKNFYKGTYEDVRALYDEINLPIVAVNDDAAVAQADVYLLLSYEGEVSENIQKLFRAGKIFIESMGIKYQYGIVYATNLLKLDTKTYNVLLEESPNWAYTYKNYFTISATSVSGESAPTFEKETYYKKETNNYFLLIDEPEDWSTNYSDYYTIVATPVIGDSAPEFVTNTYYELDNCLDYAVLIA